MLVHVTGTSESDVVVTLAEVRDSDVNATYPLRTEAGDTSSAFIVGLSMRKLIQTDVGLPVSAVTFIEFSTRGGRTETLSRDDLGDPSDPGYPFLGGLMPVVYAPSSEFLQYTVPQRTSTSPTELDQTEDGGAITMVVHTTGTLLEPVVTADDATIDAGGAVAFSVGFEHDPSASVTYSWDFGDGPDEAAGASVSHTYASPGTYLASVTVRGADGSLGISEPVRITVGAAAAPSADPTPGSGTATTPAPTTGPAKGSGHRGGAKTTTKPNDSTAKNGTSSTSTPGPVVTSAPGPTQTPTPTPAPTPLPTATSAGEQVTGVLIDAPDQGPGSGGGSARSATAPATRAGRASAIGWGTAGGAATVVLLGLGVLLESGVLRPRSWRRRGIR